VGPERGHAEFLGQSERLLVVDFSLFGVRGLTLRGDLAMESQSPRLVAAFLTVTSTSPACC
jgi:hypothetical protein